MESKKADGSTTSTYALQTGGRMVLDPEVSTTPMEKDKEEYRPRVSGAQKPQNSQEEKRSIPRLFHLPWGVLVPMENTGTPGHMVILVQMGLQVPNLDAAAAHIMGVVGWFGRVQEQQPQQNSEMAQGHVALA